MSNLVLFDRTDAFEYTEGDYTLSGRRVMTEGAMNRIDAGMVCRGNEVICNYSVTIECGEPKLTLLGMSPSDAAEVVDVIQSLIESLGSE